MFKCVHCTYYTNTSQDYQSHLLVHASDIDCYTTAYLDGISSPDLVFNKHLYHEQAATYSINTQQIQNHNNIFESNTDHFSSQFVTRPSLPSNHGEYNFPEIGLTDSNDVHRLEGQRSDHLELLNDIVSLQNRQKDLDLVLSDVISKSLPTDNLELLAETCTDKNDFILTEINEKSEIINDPRPHKCDKCSKTFKERYKLRRHEIVHSGEKKHECAVCLRRFTQKYGLMRHLKKIHNMDINERPISSSSWPYNCSDCGRGFKQKSALDRHLQVAHSGSRQFVCDICNRDFSCVQYLDKHSRKIHSKLSEKTDTEYHLTGKKERPHKCSFCGKGFKDKTKLKRHAMIHTGERKHECQVCRKAFGRNDDVIRHMTRKHVWVKPFKCVYCSETFTSQKSLKEHKVSHTKKGDRCYVCDICDKSFPKDSVLQLHRQKKHQHDLDSPYKCSECSKRFKLKNNLRVHMRVHTGEKPFRCQYCSKAFTYNYTLKIHTRVHVGSTPNACTQCSKSFIHRSDLVKHSHLHTGKFRCTICNKCYSDRRGLQLHSRIHSGDKPYKCDQCDKAFTQHTYLQSHLKIHSGERPHACLHCGRKFSHKNSMKEHIRIHTGEKPHICEHCGKTFAQQNTLKQHVRTHTGEKPYKCTICHKSFTQRNGLRSHRNTCRKIQDETGEIQSHTATKKTIINQELPQQNGTQYGGQQVPTFPGFSLHNTDQQMKNIPCSFPFQVATKPPHLTIQMSNNEMQYINNEPVDFHDLRMISLPGQFNHIRPQYPTIHPYSSHPAPSTEIPPSYSSTPGQNGVIFHPLSEAVYGQRRY